jgi:hypothetical protein
MATATKKRKEEAYPWKASASRRHITNLRQSILETFDIYGSTTDLVMVGLNPGTVQQQEKVLEIFF